MAFLQRTMNRGSVSTGYEISNSLLLDNSDSSMEFNHHQMSPGGDDQWSAQSNAGTNSKKATISMWVKRSKLSPSSGAGQYARLFQFQTGGNATSLYFVTDQLKMYDDVTSASLQTTRKFRDLSAWYHIVLAMDSTQSTAANRVKLYVNGEQQTAWDTEDYGNQNSDLAMFSTTNVTFYLGCASGNGQGYSFDGYITEFNFVDGAQKAASDFGEYDEDSGVWKPKEYTDSYGTLGCYYNFEDTSNNRFNDESGNGNFMNNRGGSFEGGITTDTPTNNFCTVNNITRQGNQYGGYTIAQQATHGGTVIVEPTGSFGQISGTIGVGAGKWYWEMKAIHGSGVNTQIYGITSPVNLGGSESRAEIYPGATTAKDTSAQYSIYPLYSDQSRSYRGDSDSSANWTSSDEGSANNTIWRIALDLDNGKIWYGRNNVWLPDKETDTASNPSTGSNARDTDLLGTTRLVGGFYLPSFGMYNENSGHTIQTNFGGYSEISNSKSYSDANGYGAFVYAVPTGFYAICSKNLAEYGG